MLNFIGFISIISIIIVAHEFGHFISARRNGVKVEKFAIGFGPVIFKKKIKSVEFLICLLPLGGYVKLAGDERSKVSGKSDEFLMKSIWTRIKIVFAGPLFNYFLAFIIFWIVSMAGMPYQEAVVGKLLDSYPAQSVGIKEGDKIIEVNNKKVKTFNDMANIIYKSKDKVLLKVERNGEILNFQVPLKTKDIINNFGKKQSVSVIGISSAGVFKIHKYNFFSGFLKAIEALLNLTFLIINSFILIILGIVPVKEAVAGPLGIYYITSETIKLGIVAILNLMAVLSVSLAIINLFPLPVLDGGHIILFIFEKIRNKPLSERMENILNSIGIIIVVTLFVFVFYNDIVRFGAKIFIK